MSSILQWLSNSARRFIGPLEIIRTEALRGFLRESDL
jgi:hypothetical protein